MRSPALRSLIILSVAAFIADDLTPVVIAADSPPAATTPAVETAAEKEDPASPEGVLRSFLLAMVEADLDGMKEKSIPNKELATLASPANRPPAEAIEQARLLFGQMPIRRMEVGEEVTLPGGKKVKISKGMVTEDRIQLSAPMLPLPFDLRRVEGNWKVDSQSIIDARKAALKAMGGRGNKY